MAPIFDKVISGPGPRLESLEQVRSRMVDGVLIASAIAGGIAVSAGLWRVTVTGWRHAILFQVALYAVGLAVTYHRRRLSYQVRALFLVGVFFVAGVAGLYSFGLVGMGVFFFLSSCLLADAFLGTRAGVAVGVASLVAIVVIGRTALSDDFSYGLDFNRYARSGSAWITATVGWAFCLSIILAAQGTVQGYLTRSAALLQKRAEELERSNRGLEAEMERRGEAERALREREELYFTLFESASDAIFLMKDDRFIDCNRRTLELFGCARDEIVGDTPYRYSPARQPDGRDSREKALEQIAASMKSGRQIFEWKHLRRDGTLFDAEVSLIPVKIRGQIHIHAIVRDLTERKQAERELARLGAIIESTNDMVAIASFDRKVIYLNRAGLKLLGWDRLDPTEWTIDRAHPPWALELIVHQAIPAAVRDGLWTGETALIRADGVEVPVSQALMAHRAGDGLVEYLSTIVRDVSAERGREASLRNQQKLEAIGALAGGVAHEINNPIGIIMNFAEIIAHDADPAGEIHHNARLIYAEGERIAAIVKNLLAFARQGEEAHVPTPITEIVAATVSLTQKILAKHGIAIETNLPDHLPLINCQSQQIMQVLMNLIINARDALNQKFPGPNPDKLLRFSAHRLDLDGVPFLRLTVEDHGVGVPPEIKERIFDPFFTTKPRELGAGLGLAVSHAIIRDHHGRLLVDSEPGRFARFHVDLPVDREERDEG